MLHDTGQQTQRSALWAICHLFSCQPDLKTNQRISHWRAGLHGQHPCQMDCCLSSTRKMDAASTAGHTRFLTEISSGAIFIWCSERPASPSAPNFSPSPGSDTGWPEQPEQSPLGPTSQGGERTGVVPPLYLPGKEKRNHGL